MEKKTTAFEKKGSDRTGDPPSRNNRPLRKKTRKSQEDERASKRRQSKTLDSRSQHDRKDSQYMKIDDGNENDNDNDGSGGEEVNDGSKEGINDADEQTNFDGAEIVEDMENDHSIASESESESFRGNIPRLSNLYSQGNSQGGRETVPSQQREVRYGLF